MKKPLIKAILWSVGAVLVIVAALVNGWTDSWGFAMMGLAVLCAGLQWLVYMKKR